MAPPSLLIEYAEKWLFRFLSKYVMFKEKDLRKWDSDDNGCQKSI